MSSDYIKRFTVKFHDLHFFYLYYLPYKLFLTKITFVEINIFSLKSFIMKLFHKICVNIIFLKFLNDSDYASEKLSIKVKKLKSVTDCIYTIFDM